MGNEFTIRLLGPFDVAGPAGAISVGKQGRKIVALLVAHGSLTDDELIEYLYPTGNVSDPKALLQVAIWRLREKFGREANVVTRHGTGYTLRGHRVDLDNFRQLVLAANTTTDSAQSVSLFIDAFALWRGVPFDGIDGDLFDNERDKLERERLEAERDYAEALVATNDHRSAIDVLLPLASADPRQERIAVLLATALAAEGERTNALDVLQHLTDVLREQSGLSPSPPVTTLHQQILEGSSQLTTSAAAATVEVDSDMPFVGRESIVEEIVDHVSQSRSCVIVGEAGIGKTELLHAVTSQLVSGGWSPVRCAIDPKPTRALAPIAELVQQLLDEHGVEPVDEKQSAAIARLLPDRSSSSSSGVSRDELIEQLAEFLATATHSAQACLLVDDVQFADSMSLSILELVLAKATRPVVVTSRPSDEPNLLRLLRGESGVGVIDLLPLSRSDVATYIANRSATEYYQRWTGEIHDRSGGNPFFVGLLVDLALSGVSIADQLPTNILVAVHDRLTRLSDRARTTLEYASALGPRFSLSTLRAVRPTADSDLLEAAEERLISLANDRETARFSHALVADGAYQLLAAGHAEVVHDLLGAAIETEHGSAIEYSHHYVLACELDPHRAITSSLLAGSELAAAHALELAVSYFQAGLDVAIRYDLGRSELAVELMARLGGARRLLGEPDHLEVLITAAQTAREIGHHDLLGKVLIELSSVGGSTEAGSSHEITLDLLEAALDPDLDPSMHPGIRAEVMAAASTVTTASRHHDRGHQRFREAFKQAMASDDPSLQARVLAHTHLGLSSPDDWDTRWEAIERLQSVAGDSQDLQWEATYLRYWQHAVSADIASAREALALMQTLSPHAKHRQISVKHIEIAHQCLVGDFDAAEALLQPAYERAKSVLTPSWSRHHFITLLFAIRFGQDRLDELASTIESELAALESTRELINWRTAAALVYARAGQDVRAHHELLRFHDAGYQNLTTDISWTGAVSLLALAAAELRFSAAAKPLTDMLTPHRGKMAWVGICTIGRIDDALAQLRAISG